jgi:hypothetical protein
MSNPSGDDMNGLSDPASTLAVEPNWGNNDAFSSAFEDSKSPVSFCLV